ncbi:HEWD family protein [Halorubrum trueperi]|uniref:HEWD family protein n=1 Tax=Halorubrum trueperi TaxID=2004704 RepID=A0ABD5UIA2_9EURY
MSVTITPPRERECELCGREERWDDTTGGWHIADEPGDVFCIHEWDINGSFTPIDKPRSDQP